jgi:hypothetical protein
MGANFAPRSLIVRYSIVDAVGLPVNTGSVSHVYQDLADILPCGLDPAARLRL